ncbi:3-carboxy-cis,cis-muconate cycloisomerase [Streptomyces sp. NPDC048639]|uniref:3-carboxy-cis,cis-muconate cycloisomerase n=1 Tax=Streptomyces sp. NPDC048639 TaxID=3365581 RepID=UPI00371C4EC2
MTSADSGTPPGSGGATAAGSPHAEGEDLGLLAPLRAGSAAEAATGDRAFLQAMLDAETALTRAQASLGQAPAPAVGIVAAAARAELYDVRDLALRARSAGNPVVPLVADLTAAVARTDPGAAASVHRGATSQDILDTASMLVAARTLPGVLADLDRTAEALARLAAEHRSTPMPGRTLTQHAVPTTFGLKAAGWRSLVLDARDRLAALALPAQLGGAAGTLAAFAAQAEAAARGPEASAGGAGAAGPEGATGGDASAVRLMDAYAEAVGLAAPALPWHTLRTPVADLATALAFTCGALGKPAADVLVLSRTEIGEVAEGGGGESSAMPHKSNPVRAALIAAGARRAPALVSVLLGALAAEDERPAGAWHAEWEPLRELLRLAGGVARAAAELAEGLRVFPERMREHLDLTDGLIVSERLAAALGPIAGRARAREWLTAASRRAAAEGIALADALADILDGEPDAAGQLSKERLHDLAAPARYTGSAAALVDRALAWRPPGTPAADRTTDGAAPHRTTHGAASDPAPAARPAAPSPPRTTPGEHA